MSTTYTDLPYTNFPDSITTFIEMIDMTIEDSSAVLGYQTAMQNGDIQTASSYLNQIDNGNQKIVNAEKLNKLMQTCMALQRYYTSEIQPYIENVQSNIETRVNQFNYMGTFSSTTQYAVNNFVSYNGTGTDLLYICIATPPIGMLPTASTYWRVLTIQGQQGVSGSNVSFRYAWNSSTQYYVSDIVTYGNAVWGCVADNSNQIPSETNATYWRLIYSSQQVTYTVASSQPSGLSSGDIWFKVV